MVENLEFTARQRVRSDPDLAEYEEALFAQRPSDWNEYLEFLATADREVVLEYARDLRADRGG
jgi:hypothetical protein